MGSGLLVAESSLTCAWHGTNLQIDITWLEVITSAGQATSPVTIMSTRELLPQAFHIRVLASTLIFACHGEAGDSRSP